jgi:hypothetical protein
MQPCLGCDPLNLNAANNAHDYTGVSAYQGCSNPIFFTAPFSAPVAYPSSSHVCSAYSQSQTVCCDAETLQKITNTTSEIRTKMYANDEVFSAKYATKLSLVESQAKDLCDSVLTQEKKTESDLSNCHDVVEASMKKVNSALNDYNTAASRCASAMVVYTSGLLCLSCVTNWDNFVLQSNSVKISTSTCTSLVSQCSELNTHYVTAKKAILSVTLDTANSLGYQVQGLSASISAAQDLCGEDCSNTICNQWITNVFDTSSVSLLSSAARIAEVFDASAKLSSDTKTYLDAALEDIDINHLKSSSRGAFYSTSTSVGTSRVFASSSVSNFFNSYSADGFDVFGIACKDAGNQDSQVCAPILPVWAVTLIVIVCVLVLVMIVAIIVVMRRRSAAKANETSEEPLLDESKEETKESA